MTLVIDASVAVKWFVDEELHLHARALLVSGDALVAPDFLAIELASIAWKKLLRGEIDRHQADEIALSYMDGIPTLEPSRPLLALALRSAISLHHPVYDCLYLACAHTHDSAVVTTDRRLLDAVAATPFAARVRHLLDG